MTPRDRGHTHLENARVMFQDSGNKTKSRTDLYAASILAMLEEAVDNQNLCVLQLMAETSRNLRDVSLQIQRGLPKAGCN